MLSSARQRNVVPIGTWVSFRRLSVQSHPRPLGPSRQTRICCTRTSRCHPCSSLHSRGEAPVRAMKRLILPFPPTLHSGVFHLDAFPHNSVRSHPYHPLLRVFFLGSWPDVLPQLSISVSHPAVSCLASVVVFILIFELTQLVHYPVGFGTTGLISNGTFGPSPRTTRFQTVVPIVTNSASST